RFGAGRADDPAVAAGGRVTAGARVGLLHVAAGEHLLVLNQYDAGAVAPLLVRPDARADVLHRIDQVLVAVVADHAVLALRGVAADGHAGVDQQVEPVRRL